MEVGAESSQQTEGSVATEPSQTSETSQGKRKNFTPDEILLFWKLHAGLKSKHVADTIRYVNATLPNIYAKKTDLKSSTVSTWPKLADLERKVLTKLKEQEEVHFPPTAAAVVAVGSSNSRQQQQEPARSSSRKQ